MIKLRGFLCESHWVGIALRRARRSRLPNSFSHLGCFSQQADSSRLALEGPEARRPRRAQAFRGPLHLA